MHSHCILILVSLAMQKLLSLIKFRLFIFAFILITLEGGIQKDIVSVYVKECSAYFFL